MVSYFLGIVFYIFCDITDDLQRYSFDKNTECTLDDDEVAEYWAKQSAVDADSGKLRLRMLEETVDGSAQKPANTKDKVASSSKAENKDAKDSKKSGEC